MKKTISILAAALFLFTAGVAVAQSHEGHAAHGAKVMAEKAPAQAKIMDGVQVVNIEVGKNGFKTDQIALAAGIPARLVFTRVEEGGCAFQVKIPAFGIEATNLPVNKPVAVEFTPEEDGTYAFVCGMDMMKGSLLVKS